jgi:hypothetical protein
MRAAAVALVSLAALSIACGASRTSPASSSGAPAVASSSAMAPRASASVEDAARAWSVPAKAPKDDADAAFTHRAAIRHWAKGDDSRSVSVDYLVVSDVGAATVEVNRRLHDLAFDGRDVKMQSPPEGGSDVWSYASRCAEATVTDRLVSAFCLVRYERRTTGKARAYGVATTLEIDGANVHVADDEIYAAGSDPDAALVEAAPAPSEAEPSPMGRQTLSAHPAAVAPGALLVFRTVEGVGAASPENPVVIPYARVAALVRKDGPVSRLPPP